MEGERNSSRLREHHENALLQDPQTTQGFSAPIVSLHQCRHSEALEVAPIFNPPFHMPNGGHHGAISNISAAASEQSDRRRFRTHACRFCPKDYVQHHSLVRHTRMVHNQELQEEQLRLPLIHEWLADEQYASHQAHRQRLVSEVSSNNGMYMGAGNVQTAVNFAETFSLDGRLAPLNQGTQSYHPTSYKMQLQTQRQHDVMLSQNATTPPELTSVHREVWQSNPYSRSLRQRYLSWNSGNVLQTAQNWESAFGLDGRLALSYQGRQAYCPTFDVGSSQRPLHQVQGRDDMTLCIPCNYATQPLTYPYGSNMPAGHRSNTLQSWQNRVEEASTLARPVDVAVNLFLSNRRWVPQSANSYINEPIILIHNPLVARFRSPLDYY